MNTSGRSPVEPQLDSRTSEPPWVPPQPTGPTLDRPAFDEAYDGGVQSVLDQRSPASLQADRSHLGLPHPDGMGLGRVCTLLEAEPLLLEPGHPLGTEDDPGPFPGRHRADVDAGVGKSTDRAGNARHEQRLPHDGVIGAAATEQPHEGLTYLLCTDRPLTDVGASRIGRHGAQTRQGRIGWMVLDSTGHSCDTTPL